MKTPSGLYGLNIRTRLVCDRLYVCVCVCERWLLQMLLRFLQPDY